MELTKYGHACVTLRAGGTTIVIDPGTFSPRASDLLVGASAALVTHNHFDHFDVDVVRSALASNHGLQVVGPASVTDALIDLPAFAEGRVTTVRDGDVIDVAGVSVAVFGEAHAAIHDGIPVPHNVGYLVGGTVFHPGDSYAVPPFDVDTLLVPVSGPWVKVGEAIDFIVAVHPRRTVAVHDAMLSNIGHRSVAMFLGETGLSAIPMVELPHGETLDLAKA